MNPRIFADWLHHFATGCASHTSRPSATVLVVDDEEPIRRFVARVMTEAGCEAVTAGSGAEALAAAAKLGPVDLLITDLMMPEMAGGIL